MEKVQSSLVYGRTSGEISNAASTVKTHKSLERMMQINQNLWMYFGSIVLLLGIVGNTLSLCVLCRQRMRKLTIGTYLITLTTSDLVASVTAVLRTWVYFLFDVDYFASSAPLCKPLTFLQDFSKLCSSWMVITITVERTFLICRPLISVTQRPCFLTPGAVMIIICIALTIVVSPEIYFVEVRDKVCTSSKTYSSGDQNWKIIDALYSTFYSFLPSLIIMPCSMIMVLKLRNNQWRYLERTKQTCPPLRVSTLPTVSLGAVRLPPSFLARMSSSTLPSSLSTAPPPDQSPSSAPVSLFNHSFQNLPRNATFLPRSSPSMSNFRHLNLRAHLSSHRLCRLRQNIRIVLIINVIFLVTTTPVCVLRFILLFADTIDQLSKHFIFYAFQVAALFSDLNIFIDLILFIASGKAFRDELTTLEPRRLRRKRNFQSDIIVCTINSVQTHARPRLAEN